MRIRAVAAAGALVLAAACAAGREPTEPPASPTRPAVEGPCRPPSLENCFTRATMDRYVEEMVPLVREYFTADLRGLAPPAVFYVADGQARPEGCTDARGASARATGRSYEYCGADGAIYLGQSMLWELYQNGAIGPAIGLAHEWGHHLQTVAGVPSPRSAAQSVRFENQADCVAGAWAGFANRRGWLELPGDADNAMAVLQSIASAEGPDRDHGTVEERQRSFAAGVDGVQECNTFVPDAPLVR